MGAGGSAIFPTAHARHHHLSKHQEEREADEAQQRRLALGLLAERRNDLAEERHRLVGVINGRELLDLLFPTTSVSCT